MEDSFDSVAKRNLAELEPEVQDIFRRHDLGVKITEKEQQLVGKYFDNLDLLKIGEAKKDLGYRLDLQDGKVGLANNYLKELGLEKSFEFIREDVVENGKTIIPNALYLVSNDGANKILVEGDKDFDTLAGFMYEHLNLFTAAGGIAAGGIGVGVGNIVGHVMQGGWREYVENKEGYDKNILSNIGSTVLEGGEGLAENWVGNLIVGSALKAPGVGKFLGALGSKIGEAAEKIGFSRAIESAKPIFEAIGRNQDFLAKSPTFRALAGDSGQLTTLGGNVIGQGAKLAGSVIKAPIAAVGEAFGAFSGKGTSGAATETASEIIKQSQRRLSRAAYVDYTKFQQEVNEVFNEISAAITKTNYNLQTAAGKFEGVTLTDVKDGLGRLSNYVQEYGKRYASDLGQLPTGMSPTSLANSQEFLTQLEGDLTTYSAKKSQALESQVALENKKIELDKQKKNIEFKRQIEAQQKAFDKEMGYVDKEYSVRQDMLGKQNEASQQVASQRELYEQAKLDRQQLPQAGQVVSERYGYQNPSEIGQGVQNQYATGHEAARRQVDSAYRNVEAIAQADTAPDVAIESAYQDYVDLLTKVEDDLARANPDLPRDQIAESISRFYPSKLSSGRDLDQLHNNLVRSAMGDSASLDTKAAQLIKNRFKVGDGGLMDRLVQTSPSVTVKEIAKADDVYKNFRDTYDSSAKETFVGRGADVQTGNVIRDRSTADVTVGKIASDTLSDSGKAAQYETIAPGSVSQSQRVDIINQAKTATSPEQIQDLISNPNIQDQQLVSELQEMAANMKLQQQEATQGVMQSKQQYEQGKLDANYQSKSAELEANKTLSQEKAGINRSSSLDDIYGKQNSVDEISRLEQENLAQDMLLKDQVEQANKQLQAQAKQFPVELGNLQKQLNKTQEFIQAPVQFTDDAGNVVGGGVAAPPSEADMAGFLGTMVAPFANAARQQRPKVQMGVTKYFDSQGREIADPYGVR